MSKTTSLLLTAALTAFGLPAWAADQENTRALNLQVYNADSKSFHVNSVLLTGEREAMLIDAQFSRADAHRLVAEILNSQKTLTTVYISHGDPDYYFGLEVIKAAFPKVNVYASKPTIDWIQKTVSKKLTFWGPKLGANAPSIPVIPDPVPSRGLSLEGKRIVIKGLEGKSPKRSYVWIPSIKAVVGGVNVFSGLHLWTADTQSKSERDSWLTTLDEIAELQPETVIPGHSAEGAPTGLAAVSFTASYLQRFETELEKAADAQSLIKTMNKQYPDLGLGIALDIGAKVNKGEMQW